jgi:hypothetical protein
MTDRLEQIQRERGWHADRHISPADADWLIGEVTALRTQLVRLEPVSRPHVVSKPATRPTPESSARIRREILQTMRQLGASHQDLVHAERLLQDDQEVQTPARGTSLS